MYNEEQDMIEEEDNNKYKEEQWTFKDGVRTIDFVLVWVAHSFKDTSACNVEKRMTFEANLVAEGLELEHESIGNRGLHFIKVHAPLEILQRYAEILKLRMPLKDIHNRTLYGQNGNRTSNESSWGNCFPIFKCCEIDPHVFPDCSQELTATYRRTLDYLFDVKSSRFFTPAHKARVVEFIMDRTLYTKGGSSDIFQYGIHSLLQQGIYAAAYPLHDGDWRTPGCMRHTFYNYWATFRNWYKIQPIDHIMQYFGVKMALYFSWVGFYTYMLIPASFVGVICFIISLILLPRDEPIKDVCSGEIDDVICPVCDHCNFTKLTDTCVQANILFVFDNTTTVFFGVFISFWAAVYVEFWRRHFAGIALRWDLTWLDEKDENPRPEYAAKLSKLAANREVSNKLNYITNAMEPRMKYWKHVFPGQVMSFTAIFFLITLAIAAVIAIIILHMIFMATPPISSFSSWAASFLNLACILILSPIYDKMAVILTELELPRTQQEFNRSLTLKTYLLQFINNYSSIFYIAFFKGKLVDPRSAHYRVFGFRQLECGAGGCMLELTRQLAVIMIGKRVLKSFVFQFVRPKATILWRSRKWYSREDRTTQWEKDFTLFESGERMLPDEYLDLVLQYGFVTIFVSAFPLAPLFALINNIFEIRIDAQKFLKYHRRPVLRRVKDIGVWLNILEYISKLAVFTNAFIIAFTSSFIPRLVYKITVSPDFGLDEYMNYSLSYMAIQDLYMKSKPNTTMEYCRYTDFREPPWSENKYKPTTTFWMVLAARLLFFIMFENLIMMGVVLVKWFIPDVPRTVQWQLRRRHYLVNEAIISRECARKTQQSVINKFIKKQSIVYRPKQEFKN